MRQDGINPLVERTVGRHKKPAMAALDTIVMERSTWSCVMTMRDGSIVDLAPVEADGMIGALCVFADDPRYCRAVYVLVEEHSYRDHQR